MTVDLDNRPRANPQMWVDNRKRMVKRFADAGCKGALLLTGFGEMSRPLSDFETHFRQESYFYWVCGADVADCAVYVDIATGHTTLFYPDLPADLAIWAGPLPTLDQIKAKFLVDDVRTTPTLPAFLNEKKPEKIYSLEPTLRRELIKGVDIPFDFQAALEAIGEERQLKSEEELKLIQYACDINALSFDDVFRQTKVGMYDMEVEGVIQKRCISHYCRLHAFAPIVSSGHSCATLHRQPNCEKILDGQLVLVDAGCEYLCYAADNTRTFPANGKFTADQRAVYQAVLDTQKAVIAAAKPGVPWPDMARLSARVMAEGLIKAGLFQNGTAEEIVNSGALAVFYPHGLGHGMGLDCHECSGWKTPRPDENHVRCLRMGRTLEPGIVVTVEPGCYFIPLLYEAAFNDPAKSKYINKEVCLRFRDTVGGIRIEDDILITKDGNRNLSSIPKEIDEIEAIMAQARQ
ncbi:Xaa-Pro dipeptidase [Tritrichomonas foetus]|uniref:Xaa-Pro dipeptidase n=1 Tax=Tritrichomonas foetus TaxID=1144522 RepID=A0A1J4JXX1_9EUKA|nr:Xaa-Pro dipeptidase [Tritrichomonas foetus]|eukprot:OHT02117.1 Xaa-Pro dipeptidase [Tritrichomonas foetus]